jgi:type IV secretion system T-DNA border endonuclease VirD1
MTYSAESLLPDRVHMPARRQKQRVDPNGYKVVSVRLREAEFEVFAEQVRVFGLTNNMALRIAARRIGGFLETSGEMRHRLVAMAEAINAISREIAKLNTACARSGTVDMKEFAALRIAFGTEFAQIDAHLRSILNVSLRRVDGRLMLQDAMTR